MTPAAGPAPAVPPRGVVVGAGLMGRWHADAVRRSGYRVAAVVDPDPARARALAARHPGALAAATLDEAARGGAVGDGDVVHVCTPLEWHAEAARAALARGCHVIVEKPVAAAAADVEALVGLARTAGRVLVPVHQYPFQHGARRAEALLPTIGPVLHVDAVACTAGADARTDAGRDAVAHEVLPHALSLLARLVGPVDDVAWRAACARPGELRVDGVLGGATVGIVVSTRGRPTRNAMRLIGAHGTIVLDLFHGYATVARGRTTRGFKIVHPFADAAATIVAAAANLVARAARREPAYPGLRELVRRVYDGAARGGGRWPIAPGETIAVARALDRIREAVGAADPRPGRSPVGGPAAGAGA